MLDGDENPNRNDHFRHRKIQGSKHETVQIVLSRGVVWYVHQAAAFFSFQPGPVGWQCFAEADHFSEDEVRTEGLVVDHLVFRGALWGCASSKKWGCPPGYQQRKLTKSKLGMNSMDQE